MKTTSLHLVLWLLFAELTSAHSPTTEEVNSPNYPANYPPNANQNKIIGENVDQPCKMTCHVNGEIEYTPSCSKDVLKLSWKGSTEERLCGLTIDKDFVTPLLDPCRLEVMFLTDSSVENKGYHLHCVINADDGNGDSGTTGLGMTLGIPGAAVCGTGFGIGLMFVFKCLKFITITCNKCCKGGNENKSNENDQETNQGGNQTGPANNGQKTNQSGNQVGPANNDQKPIANQSGNQVGPANNGQKTNQIEDKDKQNKKHKKRNRGGNQDALDDMRTLPPPYSASCDQNTPPANSMTLSLYVGNVSPSTPLPSSVPLFPPLKPSTFAFPPTLSLTSGFPGPGRTTIPAPSVSLWRAGSSPTYPPANPEA